MTVNVNSIPASTFPGHNLPKYIYYFKASATLEQWYPTESLLGYGYVNATTFRMYFRGANDVNAVDTVQLVVSGGTDLSEIYEAILNAAVYQQINPKLDHILRVFVHGGGGFRPEITSCNIVFGECCTGGGSGTMSNWILSDGSTTQQIDNAETVTFADGTFINNVVSATNTVTTDLSATGTANASTFLCGNNTWATPAGTTYSAGDGLDLTGTTFSTDLKANGGLVIESTELALDLGATSITGTLDETDGGTGLTSYTTGDVLYASGSNTLAKLAVGSNTNVLTLAGGVPTWAAPAASGCADVYKTITGTTGSTVASGCSDTLTIQSPNSSITADAATADTLKLSARKYESFVITLTDEVRPITTGVKYEFRIPYNFTIAWYGGAVDDSDHCKSPVKIHVNTPPSGTEAAALTVNVETSTNNRVSWGSIFDVKPTIDANEWSSVTSAARVQLVGDTWGTSINCDTVLRFTVDSVFGAPVGLKCIIMGYQSTIV